MGLLLREALKTMCGVNQWSYAVFWKIGCQNPKLLIWEECYFEPLPSSNHPCTSVIESPKFIFGEWKRCWSSSDVRSQQSTQAENRVHLLINKMMLNNQVNLVGEGIVGRAAFTGNHQWIISNNYNSDAHPPEVLNEVHQQFSAGMQTIAVIPVLPHGVVQLGSSLAIMENVGFVHDVKSLIFQLGCVPGALLSDDYAETVSSEKIGVPIAVGVPVAKNQSGNYKMMNAAPSTTNTCNLLCTSSRSSKHIGQSSLVTQVLDNSQATASAMQSRNLARRLANSCDKHFVPTFFPMVDPDDLSRGQLENGVVGSEAIPSNSEAWVNQPIAKYNLKSANGMQCVNGPSDSSASCRTSILQPLLSDASRNNDVKNFIDPSESLVGSHMLTNRNRGHKLHGGTLTAGKVFDGVNGQFRSVSTPVSVSDHRGQVHSLSCTHLAETGHHIVGSSSVEEVPFSGLVAQLTTSDVVSGDICHSTDVKHTRNDSTFEKERMENELFQVLNIPLTLLDDCTSLIDHVPGFLRDFHSTGNLGLDASNAEKEDSFTRPSSRDDLYDVFGVEFKNKILNGKRNNLLAVAPDAKQNLSIREVSSDFYSVDDGILGSGVFGASSTDHLLDAVVSRAFSASMQSSEETVSCRTALTKVVCSSLRGGSPAYGEGKISDQLPGEYLAHPRSLGKLGTLASMSFISGCSKDDVGNCSQTSSIYGSRISSWAEQGPIVKRDDSISTAYVKRNDEMGKSNRKRAKPGENPRPRPKDRQMIQDRVKELREIVPNSTKCSIDALLERTIKHMLFLQSVMKHADKLKQTGESKIISKEGGLVLKDNFEGGATWAFEVGSQSMVCPIIVEDLSTPRQMLVEMLCEERGFFLEIADLIRGLGLTILKGVMEARNDKIWAHFAVEANRDITRMEIFMSLVPLLEQTGKANASSGSALDNNNLMVHHAILPATSIPATGRPSSLQ
ncbi:transcription factor LHW-like isoform X1 [Tripterygium wilfordii]|uniref:Transcription factor LHW-like isoform X1 n=1 Tax=Tripterygium wilfordii TaxID=458696 RepID=A0A7J7DEY5_TRIWF|nr:transcription factor LHW [Tripterygium wilfordii]KAF5744917.1 transcription factor LHW-like isoform X1 [Tripterygium wilfordii]